MFVHAFTLLHSEAATATLPAAALTAAISSLPEQQLDAEEHTAALSSPHQPQSEAGEHSGDGGMGGGIVHPSI